MSSPLLDEDLRQMIVLRWQRLVGDGGAGPGETIAVARSMALLAARRCGAFIPRTV